jgi:hypothetical protein
MPKKLDHDKARAELVKLGPETLQLISARLPAGLLINIHSWAEQKGLDLATAIRELTTLGLETATHPGSASVADRKEVKRWEKAVKRAIQAGKSPFEPFLEQDNPNLEALPTILARMDFQGLFQEYRAALEEEDPWIERAWKRKKAEAPSHLQPLMAALDNLENRFLARKKLYYTEGPDGDVSVIHWLLSDAVMQIIGASSADDADVEAAQKLIAARYLLPQNPERPWDYTWDD